VDRSALIVSVALMGLLIAEFVRPRFVFSLDWQVFRLSLSYLLAGLLSAFISKLLSTRAAAS
jgi:ABC-type thiamin/hydroxymethylpyrimidine transport system permease subunit